MNKTGIVFDATGLELMYPGMTSWELNTIINDAGLLVKTAFVRAGEALKWAGSELVRK